MSTFIKNQSSWKLTQLKKLTFEELKTEFEKLVKSIENFVPMETDERVKRQVIAKEEEIEKSVKKREEREAFMKDKVTSASSESEIGIDVIPTATKPPIHCLTLDDTTIYMLADRKYPLSKDACQVMLKMKLLDGTTDEVCYQLLKMIEKQAGLR
ncbi:hypothetical protein Tco_0366959 [Tanacetum coccineum]